MALATSLCAGAQQPATTESQSQTAAQNQATAQTERAAQGQTVSQAEATAPSQTDTQATTAPQRAGAAQRDSSAQAEARQGVDALQSGNFAAAEAHFSRALAAQPNQVEVRANLGLAYYADHKYPQAIEQFQRTLNQDPSVKTAQAFLPLSLAAVDRCSDAVPGLRREFASNADMKLRRVIGLSLQRCLVRGRDQAGAGQVTQALLAQYPDDVDVLFEAGQMYANLSSQAYLRIMRVAPHSARGYQVMGQVAASEGNWPKAIEAYRQALAADPSLPGVHVALAVQLLLHSPDPEAWKEALTHLETELKINPASPEAEYEIAEIYRKHGQPERAVATFRRALDIDPNFVEARLELAKVLREQDQKQQALTILEPARGSDNAAVHFLLAQLYRDLGRAADADREQTRFRQLQP